MTPLVEFLDLVLGGDVDDGVEDRDARHVAGVLEHRDLLDELPALVPLEDVACVRGHVDVVRLVRRHVPVLGAIIRHRLAEPAALAEAVLGLVLDDVPRAHVTNEQLAARCDLGRLDRAAFERVAALELTFRRVDEELVPDKNIEVVAQPGDERGAVAVPRAWAPGGLERPLLLWSALGVEGLDPEGRVDDHHDVVVPHGHVHGLLEEAGVGPRG